MAKVVDYQSLYRLQNQVLESLFSVTSGFYLTGGTCLHRFYAERRYSDNLDFFTSDNALFRDDVRLVRQALKQSQLPFEVVVDSRDFVRLSLHSTLKVDLVNDRVYRHGTSIRTADGKVLDNPINIGANKICAVLGRDDPKDIFDLYSLYRLTDIDWPLLCTAAAKKCVFDAEELRFRLESFPFPLLDLLALTEPSFAIELQRDYRPFLDCLLAAW